MDVKEWVLSQRENMLDTAMELMKIRSVSEPGTREHPYGEGCAMVLDKALEIGKQMGFETENHDYRCGSILMPGRTGQEIGIFVHLDVVHEGNGWTTEPYKPVIKDGWLYGRGSADNKGPAAAALYSMKYLKEQGVPLNTPYGCIWDAVKSGGWRTLSTIPPIILRRNFPLLRMPHFQCVTGKRESWKGNFHAPCRRAM